jgi:hypothetical protein
MVCQACRTALLDGQRCCCEWDPPLEPWEDSERTRAHSRQMLVYRAELVGTAADLEGARP